MKVVRRIVAACMVIAYTVCFIGGKDVKASEAPIILIDTDFSSDVDDVLAVSVACYFADKGTVDLGGVALSCSSTNAAYAMSSLLTAHGYSNVPIASPGLNGVVIGSRYHQSMLSYPHSTNIISGTVQYYRKILSEADSKVNIITLGQLINLSDLLNSQPDGYSNLTGAELVAEKVNCVYAVAGKSNGKLENNIWYGGEDYGGNKYYGNSGVSLAAINVANNWPTIIVWMEADIVGDFTVGEVINKRGDILYNALQDYGQNWSYSFDPFGVTIACWDLEEALHVNGIQLIQGNMTIYESGTSCFIENEEGRHYRIKKLFTNNIYKSKINEALQTEFLKRW